MVRQQAITWIFINQVIFRHIGPLITVSELSIVYFTADGSCDLHFIIYLFILKKNLWSSVFILGTNELIHFVMHILFCLSHDEIEPCKIYPQLWGKLKLLMLALCCHIKVQCTKLHEGEGVISVVGQWFLEKEGVIESACNVTWFQMVLNRTERPRCITAISFFTIFIQIMTPTLVFCVFSAVDALIFI